MQTTPTSESTPQATASEQIRWPERYLNADIHLYASNEIVIAAPAETIWAWLIRAEAWPDWYPNATHIHFRSVSGPDLRNRVKFAWTTFGIRVFSKVLEFEPCTRLGWESQGMGVHAYHAWLLTPLPDGSTHVLSQQRQRGWLAKLVKKLMPNRVTTQHQVWLEALSRQALSGPPKA